MNGVLQTKRKLTAHLINLNLKARCLFFTETRAVRVLGNYICKTKMLRCDDTLPWPFFLSSKTNIVIRTYFQ